MGSSGSAGAGAPGVGGTCDPAFSAVGRAFAAVVADPLEGAGAALCVHAGGRAVVDLWAGTADGRTGRAWDGDTVTMGYSVAKAAVAVLAAHLAGRGVVDLDAPVVDGWPEFAAAGKEAVTLRWLLSHRAGLPALRRDLEPADLLAWDPVVAALAAEEPWWEPGRDAGYHAVTFGFLVGEVLRRATGRTLGRLLADHVCGPRGLDLWIGLPDAARDRLARLVHVDDDDPGERDTPAPGSLAERTYANPPLAAASWNAPALLRAEVPAVNAVGSARAWAGLLAACWGGDGGPALLAPDVLDAARATEWRGRDAVVPSRELHVGLGFQLPTDARPLLGPGSFGHEGTGGSVAVALPEAGVAVGLVTNGVRSGRAETDAADAVLGALGEVLR